MGSKNIEMMGSKNIEMIGGLDANRINILFPIIQILEKKPLSIEELSKQVKMNRSTLKHYLNVLINQNIVIKERIISKRGRPAKLVVSRDYLREQKNFWKKNLRKIRKEKNEDMNFMLQQFRKKKTRKEDEINVNSDIKDIISSTQKIIRLQQLENDGLIIKKYSITAKGLNRLSKK